MSRKEFPARVRVAVIKRATKIVYDVRGKELGVIFCEKCFAIAKRFQIDHIDPDGLTGKPVIENAMLICEPCYQIKNPLDTSIIAKAKRREAKDIGAKMPKPKIPNRGFPPGKPKREKLPPPPRTHVAGQPI